MLVHGVDDRRVQVELRGARPRAFRFVCQELVRRLAARHQDLKIGLTDAVNAVLAERYDTNEILTTDQRHFRVITPLTRRFDAFRILPADL